jgi:hypothetical protein
MIKVQGKSRLMASTIYCGGKLPLNNGVFNKKIAPSFLPLHLVTETNESIANFLPMLHMKKTVIRDFLNYDSVKFRK